MDPVREMGHSHSGATKTMMSPRPEQGHNHISKILYQGKQPENVGWINGR